MYNRQLVSPVAPALRYLAGLIVVMGLLFASMPAFAQGAAQKFGYVDLQKALNEIEEGKKIKAQLEKDFKGKQAQLDAKQQQVVKLKEQFESQAMMLSEDARRQKGAEFQQHMYELQQLYVSLQGELAQKEGEATKKIFEKMRKIIEGIGKEQSYTMIFERTESSVLYARDGMDLTAELVKRYNTNK
ncbi:MAG: OmpH family outer membrane protein [Bradymonadaceae bacterium]|nr:OmpH family outer membrane protein [Lujinxingiaceae bacterium]